MEILPAIFTIVGILTLLGLFRKLSSTKKESEKNLERLDKIHAELIKVNENLEQIGDVHGVMQELLSQHTDMVSQHVGTLSSMIQYLNDKTDTRKQDS